MTVEDGFVAGAEALALGVLVFVVGTLLVLSGWSLVDGKFAVEAAAREAARGVVEAPVAVLEDATVAAGLAEQRAVATVTAHRGPGGDGATWRLVSATVSGEVARCAPITATVVVEVDTVRLPLLRRGFGSVELRGEHVERIEPYRSGLSTVGAAC